MHILCFRYPVWTATPSRNIILLRATSLSWLQAGGWRASKIIKICIDHVEMDQNHIKTIQNLWNTIFGGMNMHLTRSVPYVGVHEGTRVLINDDQWPYLVRRLWWILFTQASQYLDRKHGSNVILSHNREFQTQLPECETPAGAEYILLNWV